MNRNSQKPVLDIVLAQTSSMAELAWHVNPHVALAISPNEADMFLDDVEIIREWLDDLAKLVGLKEA
jgi:urease accessory protein UreE